MACLCGLTRPNGLTKRSKGESTVTGEMAMDGPETRMNAGFRVRNLPLGPKLSDGKTSMRIRPQVLTVRFTVKNFRLPAIVADSPRTTIEARKLEI